MREKARGKKPELTSEEVKATIVAAAKRHFARHGYQGASLKDIAADAKVAGSLINYHYKDKAGLFRSCIGDFMRGRMEAIIRILKQPQNHDEMRIRLELFVSEMMESVYSNAETFEILDREIRGMNPLVLELFQDTMLVAFKSVVEFFEDAKKRGLLDSSMDPMVVSSLLFTATCDVTRKQNLGKKFFGVSFEQPEWRKKVAEHIVHLFMKGVLR